MYLLGCVPFLCKGQRLKGDFGGVGGCVRVTARESVSEFPLLN